MRTQLACDSLFIDPNQIWFRTMFNKGSTALQMDHSNIQHMPHLQKTNKIFQCLTGKFNLTSTKWSMPVIKYCPLVISFPLYLQVTNTFKWNQKCYTWPVFGKQRNVKKSLKTQVTGMQFGQLQKLSKCRVRWPDCFLTPSLLLVVIIIYIIPLQAARIRSCFEDCIVDDNTCSG